MFTYSKPRRLYHYSYLLTRVIPDFCQSIRSNILNDEILSYVANAGHLLLLNPKGFHTVDFKAGFGSSGGYFFTKPAHYPPYEDGNCGTIIRDHKMLGDFPHDGFADLQFYIEKIRIFY